jgi:sugar lactone lactonase YvrE
VAELTIDQIFVEDTMKQFQVNSKIIMAAGLVFLLSVTAWAQNGGPFSHTLGDSNIFAPFPASPGFPEGIAIEGDKVYVSGPAAFGNFAPSKVVVYDLNTGVITEEITIQGQNPMLPHALSGIAFGKKDILYVIDTQQGIIRFDVDNPTQQQVYATAFPDLPSCSSAPAPCSPTPVDTPPLPNDLVFDKDGNGYVSDSLQATIWRIPAGGGTPQIWFQDPILATDFGPNGMRLDKNGQKLYFAVTFAPFGQGFIYTLPLVNNPQVADLQVFHRYTPAPGSCAPEEANCSVGVGPDGLAFGKSDKLYVVLAGSSQISVLRPDGREEALYSGPANGPNNTVLPWVNPANIAFNDKTRSLMVTNHAIFAPNPAFFGVFSVFVNDKGAHLSRPNF